MSPGGRTAPAPAVLRLVQMAILDRMRATGEDLYREVCRLAGIAPGHEVIVAGCGRGVTTEWIATRAGALVTGVDADPDDILRAEEHARRESPALPLVYQQSQLDDLPYETGVFDVAIGEPELASASDVPRAVAELVRVTRPMGVVVLVQLTWSSELRGASRELVVERLGLRPRLLVEWKQMLRDAGAVEIQVDDWTNACDEALSDGAGQDGARVQLTWHDKLEIVGHAFRRAGWREAFDALSRERELLRELSRERSMNFAIIKGVKWPHAPTSEGEGEDV